MVKDKILLVGCWVFCVIIAVYLIYVNNLNHQPWNEYYINQFTKAVQTSRAEGIEILDRCGYDYTITKEGTAEIYEFDFDKNPDVIITVDNDNFSVEQHYTMDLNVVEVMFFGIFIGSFLGITLWYGIRCLIK